MKSDIVRTVVMSEVDYLTIWDKYQLEYSRLKQLLVEMSTQYMSSTCLTALKSKYVSIINSKRDCDNIRDVCSLLEILENRSILDYNKIEPLKYIGSEFIQDIALNKMIQEYEMNIKSHRILPLFNVYHDRSIARSKSSTMSGRVQIPRNGNRDTTIHPHVQSPSIPQKFRSHRTLPTSSNFEQQRTVFQQLSTDLDRYWRDLARFLDVTESEIDEIDRNTDYQLHEKAFKALVIFGGRSDPSTWQITLIQALKDVRRRDLTDVVDRILNVSS